MDKSTNVKIQSNELLYINITHAFLESTMSLSETLAEVKVTCHIINCSFKERKLTLLKIEKPLSQTAPTQVRPYLIQNFTGYDMSFWNMSNDSASSDKNSYKIKSGESIPWTFRDWKKRREVRFINKVFVSVTNKHVLFFF
jgi:vacuolar protein sorting-associated protein 13A/C